MTNQSGLSQRTILLRAFALFVAALTFGLAQEADAQKITDIKVEYVGSARVAKGAILANMKTKVGDQLDPSVLDEDLKRLNDSGLVENAFFLQEPYNGGARLIVSIEARAKLREILFIGNSAISSKKLRHKIDLVANESWDDLKLQQAQQDIREAYAKEGFSTVDVDYSVDAGEDGFSRITFKIDEGQRTILDSIQFEGNTVFSDKELASKMKVRERKMLRLFGKKGKIDNQALEDDVETIEGLYGDAGYVNARVMDVERRPNGRKDHVDLVITISEGAQHSVASVSVSGTSAISEETITSRLQMQPGMAYSAKAVREDMKFLPQILRPRGIRRYQRAAGTHQRRRERPQHQLFGL